jgi:hypothetical protein
MKEIVLLLLLILTACEKESNYRFEGLSALKETQEKRSAGRGASKVRGSPLTG